MPAPRGNPNKCPECNRLGSSDADVKHLCKACLAKKVCIQCGEPAYKYLVMTTPSTHSWYCELHYNERIEGTNEEGQYIVRDKVMKDNVFTNPDEFVPKIGEVGLISNKYGLEK